MGGEALNIGSIKDGADYYGIAALGNADRANITVQGVKFGGVGTAHEHAIAAVDTTAGPSRLIVENNQFYFFNDLFNVIPSNSTNIITGNASGSTLSTTPFNFNGSTHKVAWANNFFDQPLTATATCGGSSCSSIEGAISGTITVGSAGAPITSGTLTLPFTPIGFDTGACRFSARTSTPQVMVTGFVSGTNQWTWTASGDVRNNFIDYSCLGAQ